MSESACIIHFPQVKAVRRDRIGARQHRLGQRSFPLGGDHTGPNLTDCGKLSSKHHVIVDKQSLLLVATLSEANVNDSQLLRLLIRELPANTGLKGRPRKRPTKLHADKGYDYRTHQR